MGRMLPTLKTVCKPFYAAQAGAPAMADKPLTAAEMERNRHLLRHVKKWLKHRDKTQRDLANHLGLSDASISKWLMGRQAMTVAQFVEVSNFLSATPEQLLFAPPDRFRADRYRVAAQVAAELSDADLAAWVQVGRSMRARDAAD